MRRALPPFGRALQTPPRGPMLSVMDDTFRLTGRAAARIAEIVAAERTGAALRVAVLAGGCNGFQYRFDLDRPAAADDLVIEQDGARVVVDPASLDLLAGGELDYADELMGAYFAVKNPQAKSSCGCGTSFRSTDRDWTAGACGSPPGTSTRSASAKAHVRRWLEAQRPDVLFLQEIKCEDAQLPGARLRGAGLPRGGGRPEGL